MSPASYHVSDQASRGACQTENQVVKKSTVLQLSPSIPEALTE